jgi:Domain of unknown function (DUF4392)
MSGLAYCRTANRHGLFRARARSVFPRPASSADLVIAFRSTSSGLVSLDGSLDPICSPLSQGATFRTMASSTTSAFSVSLDDAYASFEGIIQQDVGNRGIKPLIISGDLERAACSFIDARKIIVLTGFPCRMNDSPPTESDGPPGAIALAAASLKLSKPTAIITDDSSKAVMEKCSEAAGLKALAEQNHTEFHLYSFPAKPDWTAEHDARLRALAAEYDHAVAIERAGKAVDGSFYTMRALKMDHLVAPIDDLLTIDCACSVYNPTEQPSAGSSGSGSAPERAIGLGGTGGSFRGVIPGSSGTTVGGSSALEKARSTRKLVLESVAEGGGGSSHPGHPTGSSPPSPLAAATIGATRLEAGECDYDDGGSSAPQLSARATPEPDEFDGSSGASSSSAAGVSPSKSGAGIAASGRPRRASLEGGASSNAAAAAAAHPPLANGKSNKSASGGDEGEDGDDDDDRWASLSVAPSVAPLSNSSTTAVSGGSAQGGGGDRRKQRINSMASVASAVPYRGDIWTRAQSLASIPSIGRTSTGIGDGGNECGMGKVLPLVQKHIKNGETIACATPCDNLITAGVSNWGGWGLVAAVEALLRFNHLPRMEKEANGANKPATTPSWGSGNSLSSPSKKWGAVSSPSSSSTGPKRPEGGPGSSSSPLAKQPSLRPGWGTFVGLPRSATTAGYLKASEVMQASKNKEKASALSPSASMAPVPPAASSSFDSGSGSGDDGSSSGSSSSAGSPPRKGSGAPPAAPPKTLFALLTTSKPGFLLPSTEQEQALARAMIESGARDGISGNLDGSVDGMPLEKHLEVLGSLRGIVEKAFSPAYTAYSAAKATGLVEGK